VRSLCNLFALIAAAAIPLQLPMCLCAAGSHEHKDAGEPALSDHHGASHGRVHIPKDHSHDAADSLPGPHSHHTGPCHEAGHTNSVPRADDGEDGSCQCCSENTLAAPPAHIERLDSNARSVHRWMNPLFAMATAMGHDRVILRTHDPPSWLGRSLLSLSQGNPCALANLAVSPNQTKYDSNPIPRALSVRVRLKLQGQARDRPRPAVGWCRGDWQRNALPTRRHRHRRDD